MGIPTHASAPRVGARRQDPKGNQVRVSEPAAHPSYVAGSFDDTVEISLRQTVFEIESYEIRVLNTLGFITEQPLSSTHPARADLNLTPQKQGHGQAEGVERRLSGLIPLEIQAVGGFKSCQRLIDVTEPPCGVAESREIVASSSTFPLTALKPSRAAAQSRRSNGLRASSRSSEEPFTSGSTRMIMAVGRSRRKGDPRAHTADYQQQVERAPGARKSPP
jgi:hypothetical protein